MAVDTLRKSGLVGLALLFVTGCQSRYPTHAASARDLPIAPRSAAASTARTPQRLPEEHHIRAQLARSTISGVQFTRENGTPEEVVRLLRTVTGLPILISPAARTAAQDADVALELTVRSPLSAAHVLDLLTEHPDLGWTVRNGVVEVTTAANAGDDVVMHNHDVRDLTFARTEFLPPTIGGIPTADSDARSGSEGDEKLAAVEPDALVQAVKLATDPGYWDSEGGGTIEFVDAGYLLVMAAPAMQRSVARVLDGLR